MELSASASPKREFLTSKFQVGSAKSDRITYLLSQKVFHRGDVPKDAIDSKRTVQKQKRGNILGTEQHAWNQSTTVNPKAPQSVNSDLKRQLLKVRAGLMDEYVIKPSKFHTDELIRERQRFVVNITGQGPVGKFGGKWFNTVDERGLSSHCISEDWPDWNHSHSAHTKEDVKDASAVLEKQELRRLRMSASEPCLNKAAYVRPTDAITNLNDRIRERKDDFKELREQFKEELRTEFPDASEQRLSAMAQRLMNEKLLADEKMQRFPVQSESFKPNLAVTNQDRRYKVYRHPGAWAWNEAEEKYAWTCCLNFSQNSKGCEHTVVNPDAWCTMGYERGIGMAAAGKA